MTELFWRGTEDTDVFLDTKRNIEYHPSERPREVPDEAVEWYLSIDGWEHPSDEEPPSDAEFDAHEFVDRHWQTVTAAIRHGAVDEELDAVEAAERGRDGGPREESVLETIDERRQELNDPT